MRRHLVTVMRVRASLGVLSIAGALAACSIESVTFRGPTGAPIIEDCATIGDEDGNRLADCEDPVCASAPSCLPDMPGSPAMPDAPAAPDAPATPDAAMPDAPATPEPPDPPAVEDCSVAGDEDGNGLADCADAICAALPACTVVCGNGVREGNEDCDDNNTITEACAYGVTACTVCDATCRHRPGAVHVCGDGFVDTAFEVCDDGNVTCGSCDPSCQGTTIARASGEIQAVSGVSLNTGDRFVLGDGQLAITYTFSFSPSGPNEIPFNPFQSSSSSADDIADAINASGLAVIATRQGSVVMLQNQRSTSLGNVPIIEQVNAPGFEVVGMSGGQGANCPAGATCTSNADCASFFCNGGHRCQ